MRYLRERGNASVAESRAVQMEERNGDKTRTLKHDFSVLCHVIIFVSRREKNPKLKERLMTKAFHLFHPTVM